jgi:hypothetical protein
LLVAEAALAAVEFTMRDFLAILLAIGLSACTPLGGSYPGGGYQGGYGARPYYGYGGYPPYVNAYGYRRNHPYAYPPYDYRGRYPHHPHSTGYGLGGYNYRPPKWNPPMTQAQKDLNTIYDHRNQIARLPHQQQRVITNRAQELQRQRGRALRHYQRRRW